MVAGLVQQLPVETGRYLCGSEGGSKKLTNHAHSDQRYGPMVEKPGMEF